MPCKQTPPCCTLNPKQPNASIQIVSATLLYMQQDLRGWLGNAPSPHPRGLQRLAAPLLGALHCSFQEPLLLSVVNLRDAVRAPCFTIGR
jgi:hypothetical protein